MLDIQHREMSALTTGSSLKEEQALWLNAAGNSLLCQGQGMELKSFC